MTNFLQAFYLFTLFVVVTLIVWFAVSRLILRSTEKKRLSDLASDETSLHQGVESNPFVLRLVQLVSPMAKLSLPEEGWQGSHLRLHFIRAGLRGNNIPVMFYGVKTLLAFLPPVLFLIFKAATGLVGSTTQTMLFLLMGSAAGYYLPNIYMHWRIARRRRALFESFPDALDLMTVSVEAGLGLDAAINRVGDEIRLACPILSEELRLVALELRAGSSRERALRNLALRTGLDDIETLVAMLIQADRFGTSVSASLRVHAESLRTKRRFRAEEAAAKLPVKLLFPLIFCIFPSLLLVLLGPAFINIYRVLLPTLAGH